MKQALESFEQVVSQHEKLIKLIYTGKKSISIEPHLASLVSKLQKFYYQQPDIACLFIFIDTQFWNKASARAIKLSFLLLKLNDEHHFHPATIKQVLMAALIRDICALPHLLKKDKVIGKESYAKLVVMVAHQSAKLLASRGIKSTALSKLVQFQYERPDGKGPFKKAEHQLTTSQNLFNWCCHVTDFICHPSRKNSLDWHSLLNKICRAGNSFGHRDYLESLHKTMTAVPVGSCIVTKDGKQAVCLYQVQTLCFCLPQLEQHTSRSVSVVTISMDEIAHWQHSFAIDSFGHLHSALCNTLPKALDAYDLEMPKSKTPPAPDLSPKESIFKLQRLAHSDRGVEIKELVKVLEQYPIICKQIRQEAQLLSRKHIEIESLRQAVMMLGLNRVPYWLVRSHIEKQILGFNHNQLSLSQTLLFSAQEIAAELVKFSQSLLPEQGKLLMTYLMTPAIFNQKVAIKSTRSLGEKEITTVPELFYISPDSYPELCVSMAKQWQEVGFFVEAIGNQLKQPKQILTNIRDRHVLAISILSIHSAYSICSGLPITTFLQRPPIKDSLKSLKITDQEFIDLHQQKSLERNAVSSLH